MAPRTAKQKRMTRSRPLRGCLLTIFIVITAFLGSYVYSCGWLCTPCSVKEGFLGKLVCGASQTYVRIAPYFRSLPSDAEMMDNFFQHRADFERLVQIYREDLSIPTNCVRGLEPTPEVKEIMNRIHVSYVQGDGQVWIPPNPYSTERIFLKKMFEINRSRTKSRAFSGVLLYYAHEEVQGTFGTDEKRYWYIPVNPRVYNGIILTPFDDLTGPPYATDSLDDYPPKFEANTCACRCIDDHWFIELCTWED